MRNQSVSPYITQALSCLLAWAFLLHGGGSALAAGLEDSLLYQAESLWNGHAGGLFRLCRITSNGALPFESEQKHQVYFEEDSDDLSSEQILLLDEFMAGLPKNILSIRMEAHADQCGDPGYNVDLSRRRGLAVWGRIHHRLPRKLRVLGDVFGELASTDHGRHDRYVEIIVKIVEPRPEFAHLVVFDVSGSMDPRNPVTHGRTVSGVSLSQLKNIELAPGTLAFVSRDSNYPCQGTNLRNYTPVGEDFYFDAMMLLSLKSSGLTEAVTWTDDTDPARGESLRALEAIASKKGLRWEIY